MATRIVSIALLTSPVTTLPAPVDQVPRIPTGFPFAEPCATTAIGADVKATSASNRMVPSVVDQLLLVAERLVLLCFISLSDPSKRACDAIVDELSACQRSCPFSTLGDSMLESDRSRSVSPWCLEVDLDSARLLVRRLHSPLLILLLLAQAQLLQACCCMTAEFQVW